MSRRKVKTSVYLTPGQVETLSELHRVTKIPVAEFIREGIDLIVAKRVRALLGEAAARRAEPIEIAIDEVVS